MTPVAQDRPGPISAPLSILFLVAIVLLAVVIPAPPASAKTRGRGQTRHKKATHSGTKTKSTLPESSASGASEGSVVHRPVPARSKKTSQPHRSRLAVRNQGPSSLTQRSASLPGSTAHVAPVSGPVPGFPVTPASPPPQTSPMAEEDIVTLTNQVRQSSGLGPLAVDDRLTRAAQIQADAMASLNVMDHTLPGAPLPTLASRLQSVGYGYLWAGENIACSAPDAATVESLWLNSPPHRANILSPLPTSTGVAVAYSSQGEPFYCQVFGQANP